MSDWKLQGELNNINLDSAKFFFSQAETMLKDLLADYHLTTKRAYGFLSIVTPIALFGFKLCYDYLEKNEEKDWRFFIGLSVVVITIIIFNYLRSLISPNTIVGIGSTPSKLMHKNLYKRKDDPKQAIAIYLSEIQDYEKRIKTYVTINKSRGEIIQKIIILLVVLASVTLLFYLVGQV